MRRGGGDGVLDLDEYPPPLRLLLPKLEERLASVRHTASTNTTTTHDEGRITVHGHAHTGTVLPHSAMTDGRYAERSLKRSDLPPPTSMRATLGCPL